jgi:hypothetical protein
MDVSVRGSRSSAQDWARAQQIPLSEIPPLDDQQKEMARQMVISEEDYARSAYAGQLSQQDMLQRTLRFGRWLNARVEERNADSHVDAVELDTWNERLKVRVLAGTEPIVFEVDEELIERFMTTGSAELERAIFRLLDINLPQQRVARAS